MAVDTDVNLITCVALFATPLILIYLYLNRKYRYWSSRGVTSLTFRDVLSNLRDILTKPSQDVQSIVYRKYGRIHGTYAGVAPVITVADPVLLKQILVKDFHVFHNTMKISFGDPTLDKMLSITQDDDWKRIRCIVSPTFSSSRMRKMAYLVRECAEEFAKVCGKTAEKNEELDCKKYYAGFSTDVIASAAFGTKVNALTDPNHPFVLNARKFTSQDASLLMVVMFLFPRILRFANNYFFGKAFEYLKHFALHVIEERERNNIRRDDFLQLMLDAQRGKLEESEEDLKERNEDRNVQTLPDHKTMSFEEMVAQCFLFLFAGGETTSTTLTFLSYYMALHPDCQERLIEEVDRTWDNNEEITFDVVNKMTYLDAVICEVLRMQPALGQLVRTPSEDYVLGDTGITIEKNVQVIVPVYSMHHDPEFFPDPEIFDPERFMPENVHCIPPYVYLPFGDGPRNCIGRRFALMVVKLCVVYLFRTVQLEATENTKKPLEFYKGQSVLQPKKVMVRMVKREDVMR